MTEAKTLLLEAREISKSFAQTRALSGASLELRAGVTHALLGANGAGKSTLSRVISGHINRDRGEILYRGRPLEARSPRDALDAGIAIVMQETSLVPDLSVFENIFLPELGLPGRFRRRDFEARAASLLTDLGASTIRLGAPVRSLTIAQRQLVEIAKALALDSRVIIFDEPTASLSPHEADRLFDSMRALAERQKGIVFVSHRLEEIFALTDRISVLREGRTVACALRTSEITPSGLIRTMVGYELSNLYARSQTVEDAAVPPLAARDAVPVLAVEHLAAPPQVRDVSFVVHRGEIVGLAGLVGAGRSETAQAIFGLRPITGGSIRLGGQPFRARTPADAVRAGLGLVPEDRRVQALVPDFSVRENVLLAALGTARGPGLPYGERAADVRRITRELGFADESVLAAGMLSLSGGMQQKVVLARWLLLGPRLLILDEPTRGVDIATRSSIYAILREIAQRGVGVLLISSDFEEVLGLADRIVVIADGSDVTNIPAAILDVEKLAMFAAPRTSAEGTHRVLVKLAERFGGAVFWVYVERGRAYCFDRAGASGSLDPGLERGSFPLLAQTRISRALAERRADAFVVDEAAGCATLIVPLAGYRGHDHGSIGLTLPAGATLPASAEVAAAIHAARTEGLPARAPATK